MPGTGTAVNFYWDDITHGGIGITPQVEQSIQNFEDTSAVYTFQDFGPDRIESGLLADPTNAENTVIASNKAADAETWGGSWVTIGGFSLNLTPADGKVSVKFWSPSSGKTVRLKLEVADNADVFVEADAVTTATEEWEVLVFDMVNPAGGAIDPFAAYGKFVIFYDFGNAGTGTAVNFYWDDITHGGVAGVEGPTAPTASAPAPSADSANVVSIFSDAYTDLEGTDFNPNWGQATVVTTETIDGGSVLKYAGLNYQGTGLSAAQDVSGYDTLHVDFWTADSTALNLFLINSGDVTGGDAVEVAYAFDVSVTGSWVSVDIPLSSFSPVDLTMVDQMKVDGNGTIFWDNIYFSKSAAAPTAPTASAPAPSADSANVVSIFSDAYTDLEGTDFNPNWGQATVVTTETIDGGSVLKYAGLNYQGTGLSAAQDVSGYDTLHVDFWTADSTALNLFLINSGDVTGGDAVEVAYAFDVSVTGSWVSVDIPLSSFSPVDLTMVDQMKVDGNGTIFWDNIYFSKSAAAPTAPTASAPAPSADSANVVSIFSDAYTDLEGTDFNPNWGQATVVTTETIDGGSVLKYAGLNYQGTVLSAAQDVSGYDTLHVDFWTADSTALNLFLINSGDVTGGDAVEVAYAFDVSVTGSWVSVDIPLSSFSPVDLTMVDQMKVDGNGTIFWDNIYFSKSAAAPTAPTASAPAPSADSANVVSIFSDAYTDLEGTDFNPNWGQATVVTTETIDGGSVLKYAGLNYQGTALSAAQDVSGYDTLHVDFWTADSTALNLFLINSGDVTGGDAVEVAYAFDVSVTGSWVSVDIPLSSFSPVDLTMVDQMKVDGNGTIFWDNIYFSKSAAGDDLGLGTGDDDVLNIGEVINFDSMIVDYGFTDFEGGHASSLVQDPTDATNTVVQVIKDCGESCQVWAGTTIAKGLVVYPLTDTETVMTVRVWSPAVGVRVRLKLEESGDPTHTVETDAVTTIAEAWETLTFDFSNPATNDGNATNPLDTSYVFDTLSIFLNYGVLGAGETYYYDDIKFIGAGPAVTAPTASAPAPSADSANVVSIFSDAYTDLEGTDFNPNWGQATVVTTETIDGGSVLKYAGLNYQGTVLSAAQDVSGYDTLHVDFWTADSTALNLFLINSGDVTGGDAVEVAYAFDVSVTGSWVSVDIPLSSFSPVDLTMVDQMKVDGNGTIFWDNIYFSKSAAAPTAPTASAPAPSADSANVVSIFSDAYTDLEGTDFNPNWGQATVVTTETIDGGSVLKYAGLNYQGTGLSAAQDVSGYDTLHVDFWTADSTALNLFLINSGDVTGGDAVEVAYAFDVSVTDSWVSVDIPLSSFSPVDLTMVDQMKVDGNGTIYWDNIYFSKAAAASTAITIPEDKTGNGPDTTMGTDDDVTVKGSYVVGDLTFVRPPVNLEAPADTWCPTDDGCTTGNSTAKDAVRMGSNLGFRRMQFAEAEGWCAAQNGRLPTRAEITTHIVPIVGNGKEFETDLVWPQATSKYWTADKNEAGDKAFVFTTRNYNNDNVVNNVTQSFNLENSPLWVMCIGAS